MDVIEKFNMMDPKQILVSSRKEKKVDVIQELSHMTEAQMEGPQKRYLEQYESDPNDEAANAAKDTKRAGRHGPQGSQLS